jgi:peptidoglycan/LPS O-acetylase OafA/YrhL
MVESKFLTYINNIKKLFDISHIKRISFRKDINGLRAIAVLAVVFYHADFELFKGGWLGVDIFFVISGYLISNIIISELNEGTFSFKNFYLRRIKRILPALFSTLLLTIPFAYWLLTPKAMNEYVDSVLSSLFFYANYHFMNLDFYAAESTKVMPLLHTWSLAIEEQYYLLFPLLSFLIYRYFKKFFTFVVILITFGSIYLNTLSQNVDKFYRLEYRIWELLLGVLVMILSSNLHIKHLEKIGLPLMLFPLFYFSDSWINDTEPKLVALSGICLILFSNSKKTYISKFLGIRPLYLIGLSSYSIYLLHQPIFAFYRIFRNNYELLYSEKFIPKQIDIINYGDFVIYNSEITLFIKIVLITSTIILGIIQFRKIELGMKDIKKLTSMLFLILVFLLTQFQDVNTIQSRNSQSKEITNETIFSDFLCWNQISSLSQSIENLPDDCIVDNGSNEYIVIIGDSSAASVAKNVSQNIFFKNYNHLFISMGGATFFEDYTKFVDCKDCVLEWLRGNSVTVVVSVLLHTKVEVDGIYYSEKYSGGDPNIFKNNLNLLSSLSKKIILVEPYPTMLEEKPGPTEYLFSVTEKRIDEIFVSYSDWIGNTKVTNYLIKELNAELNGLSTINSSDLFCKSNLQKCFVYADGVLYYIDRDHLTIEGAKLIVDEIINLIK